MPELPDVEHFKRYFNRTSLHQKIRAVKINGTGVLKGVSGKKLCPDALKISYKKFKKNLENRSGPIKPDIHDQ